MTGEERLRRLNNISIGTRHAMLNIDPIIRRDQINRAAKTLSKNCKARSEERKAELAVNYAKYHIGSKAMSNPETHHWRYVSKEQQPHYLKMGYIFGNLSKEWIKSGYVKIAKGKYQLPLTYSDGSR